MAHSRVRRPYIAKLKPGGRHGTTNKQRNASRKNIRIARLDKSTRKLQ